jgi:hypothetical protein
MVGDDARGRQPIYLQLPYLLPPAGATDVAARSLRKLAADHRGLDF